MKFTIITPAYLPGVEYFIPAVSCDKILFADHLQYVKRSAISRSFALNKGNNLTIPVKHTGAPSIIKNKQIAHVESWRSIHVKTIRHQYNTFPFFEEYFNDLLTIYQGANNSLSKFLEEITVFFLKKLKISARLIPAATENFSTSLESGISSFGNQNENPVFIYKSEFVAKGWLKLKEFDKASLKCLSLQKIKQDSLLNISILDFLFQHGPEAPFIIRELSRSCFVLN